MNTDSPIRMVSIPQPVDAEETCNARREREAAVEWDPRHASSFFPWPEYARSRKVGVVWTVMSLPQFNKSMEFIDLLDS
jgi:hypothetical protein